MSSLGNLSQRDYVDFLEKVEPHLNEVEDSYSMKRGKVGDLNLTLLPDDERNISFLMLEVERNSDKLNLYFDRVLGEIKYKTRQEKELEDEEGMYESINGILDESLGECGTKFCPGKSIPEEEETEEEKMIYRGCP